ncbi:MAG: S8 family serine peptidase, partial [Dehalococcoidia bacterium]
MFRFVLVAAAAVAVATAVGIFAQPQRDRAALAGSDVVPGHYIVVLNGGAVAKVVGGEHNVRVEDEFEAVLHGFSAALSDAQVRALRADPQVNNVVPDRRVHAVGGVIDASPAAMALAAQAAATEVVPTGIARIDDAGALNNPSIHVAIIDTGIDATHPDLNVSPAGFSAFGGSPVDGNGHGTHVAGTIGAIAGNGIGVRGVAPGATLHAVQVLDATGSGTVAEVVAGINWVTANGPALGIRAANMSLGGSGSDTGTCGVTAGVVVDPLHKAICDSVNAGIAYAVAAGNAGLDASTQVPAAYPEVMTVSAVADYNGKGPLAGTAPATCSDWGPDDSFAVFTNFGPAVSVAAPGVCILSTWLAGGYNTISGTSMATPHVTGALALYLAGKPPLSLATWPSVKAGFLSADTRPQSDPACGTVGTNSGFIEPVLYLNAPNTDCGAPVGGPTPTATSTATSTATPTVTNTPTVTGTPTVTSTPAPTVVFGRTSSAGTNDDSDFGYINGSRFTLATPGTLTALSVYVG